MDTKRDKGKRKRVDDAASASPSSQRAPKRRRGDIVESQAEDQRETQGSFLGVDLHNSMDDSDAQEESMQEIAMLQKRNQDLATHNKLLKKMVEETLRRTFILEARLSSIERAQRDEGVQGPIADLPYEMIYVIFGFLPLGDLLNCEVVCRNWRESLCEWLRVLDLSHFNNAVNNAVVQNVTKYRKLESLSLGRCKDVTDPALTLIAESFKNLRELDIFGCQVTDLAQLKSLDKLISLRVGDSLGIEDHHLKAIPPQIRSLRLEWLLGVQNEGLANLAHMTNLVSLVIDQNDNMKQQSIILPDSLIPTLKRFVVIRQGAFTDACLESLGRFDNLEKLSLYWVTITGQGFSSMKGKLKGLRKLALRRCHLFSNPGLDSLTKNLSHLKTLKIKGLTQIDREGFQFLNRMNSLRDLCLRLGRRVIDENGISDLEFLANMRLHGLELIDAIGLTGVGIKKIVDTQEFTLERLSLGDCHLLHTIDLVPLKRLKRLSSFDIHHATHLRPSEENFVFRYLASGGIDFDFDESTNFIGVDRSTVNFDAMDEDDDDDDDVVIVQNPPPLPAGPLNNVQIFGIPPVYPQQPQNRAPLFDLAGRLRDNMPGLPNIQNMFPGNRNPPRRRRNDVVLIDLDEEPPREERNVEEEAEAEDDSDSGRQRPRRHERRRQ